MFPKIFKCSSQYLRCLNIYLMSRILDDFQFAIFYFFDSDMDAFIFALSSSPQSIRVGQIILEISFVKSNLIIVLHN